MKFKLKKKFRFEAAHRLVKSYQGKCSHIHGHSWVVILTLGANQLDPRGMVMDFAETASLKNWIEETLDHAMLVAQEDGEMLEFLKRQNQRHWVTSGNPTSETLAQQLFLKAKELGYPVLSVEIQETCTASAKYSP